MKAESKLDFSNLHSKRPFDNSQDIYDAMMQYIDLDKVDKEKLDSEEAFLEYFSYRDHVRMELMTKMSITALISVYLLKDNVGYMKLISYDKKRSDFIKFVSGCVFGVFLSILYTVKI